MTHFLHKILAALSLVIVSTPTWAVPVLRGDIVVTAPIVTVGDMFDSAGPHAERALFRAPNPGTSGRVSVQAVTAAAAKIGLLQFENPGVINVHVARDGTLIDHARLQEAITNELKRRGIVTKNVTAELTLTSTVPDLYAEPVENPLRLLNLRHIAGSGQFSARFAIMGRAQPLDATGRIDLYVDMPHLVISLPAGKILGPEDVVMRPVQMRYAQASGMPELDQIVGKQLQRPAREGMMLRTTDLGEQILIARNDSVTVYLRKGPLTLTVKGLALNAAAYGEKVSVLNSLSNKVINGFAVEPGTVQIGARPLSNANL